MPRVNFGIAIPTGTEGLMFPVPFAKVRDNIKVSQAAEELGFDSVWGNDHVSTQHYVSKEFDTPPNYYEPLLTLAAIAENTKKIKVATALLVIPFRHPVMIAKQLATLDQLTKGRVIIGVGIGAYREEYEAMIGNAAKTVHRGNMLDEALHLINRIFAEERVSFKGEFFEVNEVQSYPKPIQKSFPFYVGGNSANGWERTAKFGQGWLPAVLTPEEVKNGVAKIHQYCDKYGRDGSKLDIAPQLAISIAKTHEDAVAKFKQSQVYHHLESLKKSTLRNQDTSSYEERCLIGTPDSISEQIAKYIEAGVTTFSALLFANNTLDEMVESMQHFSEEVMNKF